MHVTQSIEARTMLAEFFVLWLRSLCQLVSPLLIHKLINRLEGWHGAVRYKIVAPFLSIALNLRFYKAKDTVAGDCFQEDPDLILQLIWTQSAHKGVLYLYKMNIISNDLHYCRNLTYKDLNLVIGPVGGCKNLEIFHSDMNLVQNA